MKYRETLLLFLLLVLLAPTPFMTSLTSRVLTLLPLVIPVSTIMLLMAKLPQQRLHRGMAVRRAETRTSNLLLPRPILVHQPLERLINRDGTPMHMMPHDSQQMVLQYLPLPRASEVQRADTMDQTGRAPPIGKTHRTSVLSRADEVVEEVVVVVVVLVDSLVEEAKTTTTLDSTMQLATLHSLTPAL